MLPLHYAAGLGKAEIVAVLLANKADVDGKTGNGLTALSIVTRGSNMPMDVIRILLENGADPNDGRGHSTPLHNAVAFQNVEAVRLLLKYKADVNLKYLGTESVLKLAGKNQEIINLLRAHGAK
jgi:ankyrin repeat protein